MSRSPALAATMSILVLAFGVGTAMAQDEAYNVTLLKQINTHMAPNDVWGYRSPGGVELAIYGHNDGTSFVDATDAANAVEIFNLAGPTSTWRDIKTYLNYAYIVTEGGAAGTGMQIVDLTDPLNPVHVTTYTGNNFTTAHNIWIDVPAATAYCCGADGGGMHILSLADPENPVRVDYFNSYYIHDLFVGGGRGYAGAISSGTLRIMNTTNPANPTTLATHGYPGASTHAAWPTLDGTHVVTADETAGGHLKVWDISDLGNIELVADRYAPGDAIIHNVFGKNDLFYISWYSAGTRIYDISDPTNPVEVAFYDTSLRTGGGFGGNWGVYPFRADGVIYSTDRQRGLFILDVHAGFAGEISGTITSGSTLEVITGASVKFVDTPFELESDGFGSYLELLGGGVTYDVITSKFGFAPDTSQVFVPEGGAVVHDVELATLPVGDAEITVLTLDDTPIEGAVLEFENAPIGPFTTDALGRVVVSGLPTELVWTVQVGRFGHTLTETSVVTNTSTTTDVQVNLPPGFQDDFEGNQGWVAGALGDTATDGLWERTHPEGSYFLGIVGPDTDASESGEGLAFVTESNSGGAFVGTSDVDNGHTTLLSPVFDATGFGSLTLTYDRWFSNRAPSQSTDEFRADVSTDGGSTWANLETIDFGTDSWAAVVIDLTAVVTPTAQMQLRFVAEDLESNTYVEAGVDNVVITSDATDAPVFSANAADLEVRLVGPNPFHGRTEVEFDLPRPGAARVDVFDVSGRRVTTLLRGERLAAGTHRVAWDGRDADAQRVAPGVYFVRMRANEGSVSRKVTLVR